MERYIIAKRTVDTFVAKEAMVAANHPLAALAGQKILKKGGNAVDAVVATHFALAVVEPFMTGIGGGGRCVIRMANGESFAMNFEPMTPAEENPFEPDPEREATMYKVKLGRPAVKDRADIIGYKAAAIPGFVKGMCLLADKFGSLDLDVLLAPAIKYAKEGYIIDTYIAKHIAFNMHIIDKFPETAKILLKDGYPPSPWSGARWEAGYNKLVNKDLAGTLGKIAKDGPDAYYKGDIASSIAEDMEKNGAFAGRKTFLGWSEEAPPFKGIVSKEYAKELAKQIDMEKALDSLDLGDPRLYQEGETTHACVVDKDRNIAGVHSSLGDAFGSKVTIKGTGIILNDKMKGYDPRPGQPDSIKPRIIKPPPSGSTILLKDGVPYMVIGSPGGYRQVCAVVRSIHCFMDYGMTIREAINAPRVFVQSGTVHIDSRMPGEICKALDKKGHDLKVVDREFGFARPNAIVIDPTTGVLHGGIDGHPYGGADQITLGY